MRSCDHCRKHQYRCAGKKPCDECFRDRIECTYKMLVLHFIGFGCQELIDWKLGAHGKGRLV
jgi:hypothetical protein